MHPTRSRRNHQHHRIHTYRGNSTSFSCFNLLTSDVLLDKVEALLPSHRERLYPPTETLSMFLAQVMSSDRSCQYSVNQAMVQRLVGGLTTGSTYTGGYCRARQRLPLGMLTDLTRYLGELMDQSTPAVGCWQGRRIRIVDGTSASMPDTAANQAIFPQQRSQQPGLGFPLCRMVGITCLTSGALINAAIGPFNGKGAGETTLLRSIQNTFQAGDIILGDALFSSYFFIAEMQSRGVDILMEQHGSRQRFTDFRRGQKLGQKDHLLVIKKPRTRPDWMGTAQYDAAAAYITVRECRVAGKTMVTTLVCPQTTPKAALATLYKYRWNIELDIRHIKDTMGMNILSCKTPEMVIKEIWVHLLAYNLIRWMMMQSALLADISPRSISFKHCLQLWQAIIQKIDILDADQRLSLLLLMSQQRVGNRPGRCEPRAVKRRPKPFPMLTRPRAQARHAAQLYE